MKTVLIDDDQHEKSTEIKTDMGVPIAETVRRAIKEYLKRPDLALILKYSKKE